MKKIFGIILTIAGAINMMLYSCSGKDDKSLPIEVSKIVLNNETCKLTINEEFTLTATVSAGIENYFVVDEPVIWTSGNTAIATVSNGKVTAKAEGTTIITAKAGNQTATCEVNVKDGIKINGVIWAKSNVAAPGTFAAKQEDHGMFYQWNRKIGWSIDNPMINSNGGTTWDTSDPVGTTWEKANDPSPAGWRVPSDNENRSLTDPNHVTSEWTTINGVDGMKFTDKVTGNTLFFPAAVGYRMSDGSLSLSGRGSSYWSSTANGDGRAFDIYIWHNFEEGPGIAFRVFGFLVRSVAE